MQKKIAQKILIVDDIAENRQVLASIIQQHTPYEIFMAPDGVSMLQAIEKDLPDLILLDIMMPEMNGFEVAHELKKQPATRNIPILFITAMSDAESKVKGFTSGGVDFITKPFNKNELLARIKTHLQLKQYQDELSEKNELLEKREMHLAKLVNDKTAQIEDITLSMVSALEHANFFNDTDTGKHIQRVSHFAAFLAEKCGQPYDFVKRIKLYASLHDVGKVGLPDNLLKKPGRYTPEEFERMKLHVEIGGRMLGGAAIDQMAKNIALYHHEKWDGSGYLKGLKGEEIPLEARITTLADVYDALTHKRVYKSAFSEEKTDKLILEGRGTHFDPNLVDIFMENKTDIIAIRQEIDGR